MTLERFRELQTVNRELNDIQRQVRRVLDQVLGISMLDGRLLTDVALSATVANLEHGLGRPWTGYLITKRSAGQTIYTSTTSTADAALHLPLLATGAVVADVWVF